MASRLFTVDLDLGLNKAKKFIFEDFSSNPNTDLSSGRIIYFTGAGNSQNHLKIYNGSAWKTVAYTDDVPSISISLDAPDLFTVSGSPAGASGSLSFEWNTAAVNTVLAGPGTGSTAAIPTFRSLVDADIPVEIARVADIPSAGTDYIAYSEKGADLGVAELDADGYVPASQLNLTNYVTLDGTQTITGPKTFSPAAKFGAPSDNATLGYGEISYYPEAGGDFYITSVAGSTTGSGAMSITSAGDMRIESTAGNMQFYMDGGMYIGDVASGNQIVKQSDLSLFITEETDPVYTASSWYTTTNNSSNWDTAYGWGNHASAGYLTTETDPVFVASEAYNITSTDTSNWDTAYGWGNHASAGYLTSITNSDTNLSITGNQVDLATDIEIAGDLIVQGDLTVNGDVTTLNTTTVNVEDNIFVLNSNVTGTPSANSGIEVERGDSANATLLWDETNDSWVVGLVGSTLFPITRKFATSINTTGGTEYQVSHSLNTTDVTVQAYYNDEQIDCAISIISTGKVGITTNASLTGIKVVVVG